MAISGVELKFYQNNVSSARSTKSVNGTEKFTLERTSGAQEYREKILSLLQRDLGSSVAPRNCSAVFTVGATLREYRGASGRISGKEGTG